MTDPKEFELDALFDPARAENPTPSDDLMARVLADAVAMQPKTEAIAHPKPQSAWAGFWDMFGGWPALSGVAAAGVAGLWLGVTPPASVEQLTDDMFGTGTTVSLLSDYDNIFGDSFDG